MTDNYDEVYVLMSCKFLATQRPDVCSLADLTGLIHESERMDMPSVRAELIEYGERYGLVNTRAEAIP